MNSGKYLVHDASQLSGLSPQTIRNYEKNGLINADHDSLTGYRYFTTKELPLLMMSRMYRAYGFALKDIKAILDEKRVENTREIFRKREAELKKEIDRQNYVLSFLRKHISRLDMIEEHENRLSFTTRPRLLCLLYRHGENILADWQLRRRIAAWMDYMPLPQSLMYYEGEEKYYMGLCLTQEDAEFLHISLKKPVFCLEPCPSVYTIVKIDSLKDSFQRPLSGILQNMAARGLACDGPFCGRVIVSMDHQDWYHGFFEYWIPYRIIRKKFS